MIPVEKLQRLIEIAWEEGWKPADTRQDLISITSLYVDDDLMSVFSKKLAGGIFNHHYETILFSHDFIKALCRAKYQQLNQPGSFLGVGAIITTDWQTQIKELAISDNRINYLWQIFGEAANNPDT